MITKSFTSEAREHFIPGPLFSNQPNEQADGNGVLYSAFYFETVLDFNEVGNETLMHVERVFNDCTVSPGVVSRGSHKLPDRQTQDDIVGYCRMAQVFSPIRAQEVYHYAKARWWIYKYPADRKFTFKEWWSCIFWKLPGIVQHIKICAGEPLNWWDRFSFFLGCWWTTLGGKNNATGRQIDLLRKRAYGNYKYSYWLCDQGVKLFDKDIRARYPNLMGDVFQVFFQRDPELLQQPVHVLARWWQGRL